MNRHINCDEDCEKCGKYTTAGWTRDGRKQYDCLIKRERKTHYS